MKIICGFPGIGKTHATTTLNEQGKQVRDMDSAGFDKSAFPGNYLDAVKEVLDGKTLDYLFISSHETVREALLSAGIDFHLVIPHPCLKELFINRYRHRGSPETFIDLVSTHWDTWLNEIIDDPRLEDSLSLLTHSCDNLLAILDQLD